VELSWSSTFSSSLLSASLSPASPIQIPLQSFFQDESAQWSGRSTSPTAIAFIDSTVQDYQQLTAAIAPGTAVYLLDPLQDAVSQITQTLLQHHGIASLQVISHGSTGQLQLGQTTLDINALTQYAPQLQSWQSALTDDADILLYGCEVGSGPWGAAFVQQFAHLTGADVAASNTLTGSAVLGGDWVLEVNTGEIADFFLLNAHQLSDYQYILPTQLVSTTSTQANGDSQTASTQLGDWSNGAANSTRQSISDDGRYVVFTSQATNLASTDTNGQDDVFLRDLSTGETILVSAKYSSITNDNKTAIAGSGRSFNPVISADGRFVAFTSAATDLVANDGNGTSLDIFLWDRETGRTTLISRGNSGQVGEGDSTLASISGDGKRIAFTTFGNLLRNGDYWRQVFVYEWTSDPATGAIRQVSVNNAGQTGNNQSAFEVPALISKNGRYVVFQSQADNLVDWNEDGTIDTDSNGTGFDIFVRDLELNTTRLVSINAMNNGSGNSNSQRPSISDDGRYVAFLSQATNLVTSGNGGWQAYARDLLNNTTQQVSVDSSEIPAFDYDATSHANISGNGQHVVFTTFAKLVSGDTNNNRDVYVRTLDWGTPSLGTTSLVSVNALNSGAGNGASGDQERMIPGISADGRYIIFTSSASNLVAGDSNTTRDVFLRDRDTNTTTLVSQNLAGTGSGNGESNFAVMNSTGSLIAFTSAASDLVSTDTNNKFDVFVFNRGNQSPVANNDSFGTNEDTVLSNTVITNDNDPDNNTPLTVSLVNGPTHGSLSLSADGTFSYTPETDYSGTDTFTYSVQDSLGATSGLASVVLSVTATNDAPVAVNDSYTFATGAAFSPTTGVLANDTDVDTPLGNLSVTVVTNPNSGNLVLNLDGTFTYTPDAGFTGSDRFTYQINDGSANSDVAIVTLNVTSTINTPPTAANDNFSGNEDSVITGDVVSNDSDSDGHLPLSATVVTTPTRGSLSLNPDGTFSYTPNANINGTDTFTYFTTDALGAKSGTATVVLTLNSVNDAPSFTVGANQTVTAGSGTQTIAGWAKGFNPGATNETSQTIASYQIVSNSNPSIFASNPTITPAGTLMYTPVASITSSNSAVIGVQVQDSGGTANGGTDLSTIQFFTIAVVAQPTLSVDSVSRQEGNSGTTAYNFTVSLSGASAKTVSVQYATADETATIADGDYAARTGTLVFRPGETSKVVAVSVTGDTRRELDETFRLNLSQPTNAQLGMASGIGTLLNDDAQPTIRANAVSQQEGRSGIREFLLTVTLSNATYETVSVDYATSEGTATAADDYFDTFGTLVFAPGETQKFVTVSVAGDSTIEQNETFTLTLSNPTNGTLATPTAIATILNDEGLTTSDFNQDGINDIVWRNYVTGQNQIWLMGASLPSSVIQLPAVSKVWVLEGVGDFNQDGNLDLLWRRYDNGATAVWYMDSAMSRISSASLRTVSTSWRIEGVGDFNQDNRPDILWRNAVSGRLSIWYMDGITASQTTTLATVGMQWAVNTLADIDDDGQIDIVWQNRQTGAVGAWLMYGTPTVPFYANVSLPSPMNPAMSIVATGDYNQDGKLDLIWRNRNTGQNLIWFLDGTKSIAQIETQSMPVGWHGLL